MRHLLATVLADALAPSLARWSRTWEKEILAHGEALSPELITFAAGLCIDHPASLRFELTEQVPFPLPSPLIRLARAVGFPVFHPSGMCLGRGISVVTNDPAILRHELVHTSQYQRLGGHREFMHAYIVECLTHGYFNAPLEREARSRSAP